MKITWFDKILIKVALAKALSRGHCDAYLYAHYFAGEFDELNSVLSDTYRSDLPEALK